MNTNDPTDLSPLSYGTGLALGLFLILGLPSDPQSGLRRRSERTIQDSRLAQAEGPPVDVVIECLANQVS